MTIPPRRVCVSMPNDLYWHDQSVIISGASSGIGRAVAERLGRCGARVGLIARRGGLLVALTDEIRSRGGRAAYAAADVTVAREVLAAVERLEAELGPCDVALAAAGIYRMTDVARLDAAASAAVVTTNVGGVMNLFAAVVPGMIERRSGRLAAVASIGAMLGLPGGAAYCASKAAVVTMMESLRIDLDRYGIKVTTLCPGFVDTPMVTNAERAAGGLMSADEAARRIVWAVERGRAEYWFPWRTWALARIGRALPHGWYRRVINHFEPMAEVLGDQ